MNNGYNVIYRFNTPLKDKQSNTGASLDATTYYTDPFFRTGNIATDDDDQLAPFSPYLDIVGTNDIGAIAGERSAVLTVNAGGVIDYTSVDAISTVGIGDALQSGDTLNLEDGIYAPIAVSSTYATTSIAITGLGSNVIIDGNLATSDNGIFMANVSSSAISNIIIRNASSTGAAAYTLDRMNGVFNGVIYDHAKTGMGIPASSTIILLSDTPSAFTVDDYDITAALAGVGAPTDFHLVLADFEGSRVTMLLPSIMVSSAADAEANLPVTVYAFATSTLIYNSGDQTYAFNQAALDDAGITLSPWISPTPRLTRVIGPRLSGIRLDGSTNITITNVTSTQNGNGISFGAGSSGITVTDSSFSANTAYDINHESASRSVFDNVSFARTSSTFSDIGDLLVKFAVRVRAVRFGSGAAIAGASVSATDALSEEEVYTEPTDASGYTAYSSRKAYIMNASSIATTNGGYNPYSFEVSTSTHATSSTSATLADRNTTVTVQLYSISAPTAPTAAAAAHVSTSTATFGWIDGSDDESSFSLEYRKPLRGEAYPGTTVSVVGSSSADITGLIPGEQYEFRVAAVNAYATSTYATSSAFTMAPIIPGPPTLSALSRTAFSISLDTSSNATSVTYAIYSSTLGQYVGALGALSATPVFQTSSTWSTVTVSSLACNTAYGVAVVARNLDLEASTTSTAATVMTSACEVISSGGGGAVGASGGGWPDLTSPAPPVATIPQLAPIEVTFLDEVVDTQPAPPVQTAPVPAPAAPPSAQSVDTAKSDAKAFGVALNAQEVIRIAAFIENGSSKETSSLGSGERRALLRDAYDTLGKAPSNADLERLAKGEIAKARSIDKEKTQLPRVRSTFRTIYGHDPDFKDAKQNLAWNTLMYRIRFPRNLKEEQRGIIAFRQTFRKPPADPFQWATVRVMGYVNR